MKATQVLALHDKVKQWKGNIKKDRKPLKDIAADLAKELGFKVPIGPLREVFQANGIETRVRSKTALRIEALEEENAALREVLSEAIHTPKISDGTMRRAKALLAPLSSLKVATG